MLSSVRRSGPWVVLVAVEWTTLVEVALYFEVMYVPNCCFCTCDGLAKATVTRGHKMC